MKLKLYRIPLLYLITGLCWVYFSDNLIDWFALDASNQVRLFIRISKGSFFVTVTAIILYFEMKRQQKRLIVSERQYRTLFAANPNPMWLYSTSDLKFIEVNDAAIEKYGYTRSEFLQMTIKDIRPVEDSPKLVETIKDLKFAINYSGVWNHMKKSGEVFIVSIVSHTVYFNKLTCRMVLITDVTDNVNQEQKLQEAYQKEKELNSVLEEHIGLISQSNKENRRLAEIINKIDNHIKVYNKEGNIIWVNKAFVHYTNYTADELTEHGSKELLAGENTNREISALLDKSIKDSQTFIAENINYTKTGKEYWVQINGSPVFDKEADLEYYIVVETVITERKEKEEKINQQNNALRHLAWLSSHEFRRPVASILSLTSLLKDIYDTEERKELIALLETSSIELDEIVREITQKINQVES
ncbi:PAS domain S-box protein [Rubrolithibacter danxiaensis]|uniref:PAS domain S-box protein n=1 Tax=Rubrolithibacter danxiaensis TaxID=3390805 RepID=UPI003BF7BC3C